jgi:nucleoside 2-deoxyribosyltransferase
MKIYLASPLFTQVERKWNRELAKAVAAAVPGCSVFLPQDIKVKHRFNDPRHYAVIFKACIQAIDESDALVAVLDGADADSGTAFEIGYAFARGKPVIGVRTDFRRGQEKGLNIMLSRACTYFIPDLSFNEDMGVIVRDVAGKIRALQKVGASSLTGRPQA